MHIDYLHIAIADAILFILTIITAVAKIAVYNQFCRQKYKFDSFYAYAEELAAYKDEMIRYNKKIKTVKKVCVVHHYMFSIFFVTLITSIIYILATSQNDGQINVILEIAYYIISGIEILFLFVAVVYQNKSEHGYVTHNTQKRNADNTTLLVAFGGGNILEKANRLQILVQHSLKVFKNTNILICYNFKEQIPNGDVVKILNTLNVKYICLPIPNKSYAIAWASKNSTDSEYIMLIDDDVYIPADINIPSDNNVHVWAYMLCAEKPNQDATVFQKYLTYCQDIEYRFAGFTKQLQSSYKKSSVLSHHGAISLYKKDTLDRIMAEHDCVFDGEDYLMGIINYFQKNIMQIVPEQYIPTVVPHKFYDLAKQRIISWDYVILKYIIDNLHIIFELKLTNFVTKFVAFYHIWTIYQDFVRIPNIIFLTLHNQQYIWIVLYICVTIIAKSLCILLILYIKHSFNATTVPIKYGLFMLIGFPIYTIVTAIFRLLGQVRYLFWFDSRISNIIKFKDRPQLPNIHKYMDFCEIDWNTVFINSHLQTKTKPTLYNKPTNYDCDISQCSDISHISHETTRIDCPIQIDSDFNSDSNISCKSAQTVCSIVIENEQSRPKILKV